MTALSLRLRATFVLTAALLLGAMLGLLGAILAIAFGAQLSRFDSRRSQLLDEASTVWGLLVRADLLPPDTRTSAGND
jgi:hypothetical protein